MYIIIYIYAINVSIMNTNTVDTRVCPGGHSARSPYLN